MHVNIIGRRRGWHVLALPCSFILLDVDDVGQVDLLALDVLLTFRIHVHDDLVDLVNVSRTDLLLIIQLFVNQLNLTVSALRKDCGAPILGTL